MRGALRVRFEGALRDSGALELSGAFELQGALQQFGALKLRGALPLGRALQQAGALKLSGALELSDLRPHRHATYGTNREHSVWDFEWMASSEEASNTTNLTMPSYSSSSFA